MKQGVNLWRINLGIVVSLILLATITALFMINMAHLNWDWTIKLVLQFTAAFFLFFLISTQSNFELLNTTTLGFLILKQFVFAFLYTLMLIWSLETFYPSLISIRIPSVVFYLIFSISWLLLFVYGLIFNLYKNIIEQEQKILLENGVQQLKDEAELFKLRQQLHPHFLFNSLNSINALIIAEPKLARTMLMKLSSFLRASIKKEDDVKVPLAKELEELDLYLEIEKVRFGDRLIINKFFPSVFPESEIAPFLLQPLVENAIKFGLYDTLGKVAIDIKLEEELHYFIFEIINPYDTQSVAPKGTGFGLNSVARRLYLLYARNDLLQIEKKIELEEDSEGTFIARLMIPKQIEQII